MPAGRAGTGGGQEALESLILHGCGGDRSEAERYYGMSFEEAMQNGMASKIVDLDYLMVFYGEEYDSGKAGEEFRLADAAVISSVLKEARKKNAVPPFSYPCEWPEDDRMKLQGEEQEQ